METKVAAPGSSDKTSKEKILLEFQPLMLPMILNLENLTLIGLVFVILLASVAFHFGPWEFVIIGVLYVLLAFPSFAAIFRTGSTTYVLTNHRLVIFTVGIRQKERSIPLDQIQEVKCKSSGLQRLYGAGDVIVYLKGLRKPVRFAGLKDCKGYAERIVQAVKKYSGKS